MMLRNKHVFVVEDNPQNRVIFQLSLMRHGALVDFEVKGPDTIFQLSMRHRIDVILLDLMLSQGISGFDIYNEIRQLPKYKTTPIIAVSAMDFAVAAPKAMEMGFAGYIPKPIIPHRFAEQVAEVVNGNSLWYQNSFLP